MPLVYRLNYQPDLDQNWAVNPGVCSAMSGLVQLQNGCLGSLDTKINSGGFSVTGSDHLRMQMFTQVNGSIRLLTFRAANIDEYTSGGVRTNRGTGYSTSTDWDATAYGNQIIACNYLDATQSSTGAGFSGLGGGSPKARRVGSNVNFVMFGDVDDGGSNVYSDMVWWSGIRNPNTYTPSQATQAGQVRLLDTPGAITKIVPFRDKFVVFKANSIYVGTYIGPPYVWGFQVVHNSIGATSPNSVVEFEGKLYFLHCSGVYVFDGQTLQSIGSGVIRTMTSYNVELNHVKASADSKEGLVWFVVYDEVAGSGTQNAMYAFGFNVRTGLWCGLGDVFTKSDAGAPQQPILIATQNQMVAFNNVFTVAGFGYIDNAAAAVFSCSRYGASFLSDVAGSFTTGYIGSSDLVSRVTSVYPRLTDRPPYASGSPNPISSAVLTGYQNEYEQNAQGTANLAWNAEMTMLDGVMAARYKTVTVTFAASKLVTLAGLGITEAGSSRR